MDVKTADAAMRARTTLCGFFDSVMQAVRKLVPPQSIA